MTVTDQKKPVNYYRPSDITGDVAIAELKPKIDTSKGKKDIHSQKKQVKVDQPPMLTGFVDMEQLKTKRDTGKRKVLLEKNALPK